MSDDKNRIDGMFDPIHTHWSKEHTSVKVLLAIKYFQEKKEE